MVKRERQQQDGNLKPIHLTITSFWVSFYGSSFFATSLLTKYFNVIQVRTKIITKSGKNENKKKKFNMRARRRKVLGRKTKILNA
jgi:hypothetical protein